MVNWVVPMSGGKVRKVHERALPAFQQVTANLAAQQASGRYYNVRLASTFVWRRIGGNYRMSTHSFGATIDINSDTNPFSGANRLITDMPQWFVNAWRDAGFCWGGDWETVKDPMHFSWKGPAATPGYGLIPAPYAPRSSSASFSSKVLNGSTDFDPDGARTYSLADGNRDGSPDLYEMHPSGDGNIAVRMLRSSRWFEACGVTEYLAPNATSAGSHWFMADVDMDTRPDLVVVEASGTPIRLVVFTFESGYHSSLVYLTGGGSASAASTFAMGDYDRDGIPDFYVVDPSVGGDTVVKVWDGASGYSQLTLNAGTGLGERPDTGFALGDRDLDGLPDIFAVDGSGVSVLTGASDYSTTIDFAGAAAGSGSDRIMVGDYEGDGREDIYRLEPNGGIEVFGGGSGIADATFWYRPSHDCEPVNFPALPYDINGDRAGDVVSGIPHEDVGTVVDAGGIVIRYGNGSMNSQFWSQDSASIAGSAEAGDRFGSAVTSGDFDSDGFADIAIGVPGESVGKPGAGGVHVMAGSDNGIDASADAFWHQGTSGVPGANQQGDAFGAAVLAGDFNGDGVFDLAVGAPGESAAAGTVTAIYGEVDEGLGSGFKLWGQDVGSVAGTAEAGDAFGSAMAAGDFDGDGFADLAIGVPGEAIGSTTGAGLVNVIYGSASGLSSSGNKAFHQNTSGIAGTAEPGDGFGTSLAVGDYDGDGYADLAIGVPGEDVGSRTDAGMIHVLFGRPGGLSSTGQKSFTQNSGMLEGTAEAGDGFGSALSSGDYDDDGFFDLAIGTPGEDLGSMHDPGAVNVMYGSAQGLGSAHTRWFTQSTSGVQGNAEIDDRFGVSLLSLDVDADGDHDLVISVPDEDIGSVADAGAVHVLKGGRGSGLVAAGDLLLWQGSGFPGGAEAGDHAGMNLY